MTEQVAAHRVTAEQLRTWRLFLRAHAVVMRKLEADLMSEQGLPLAWYDVLVQLVEAPEGRLRMTDLASHLLISRSGLTRLIDRMTAEGLVSREPAPDDGRGYFAVVTEAGVDRLRRATRTHLRGVHDYAVSRFTEAELRAAADALARLED